MFAAWVFASHGMALTGLHLPPAGDWSILAVLKLADGSSAPVSASVSSSTLTQVSGAAALAGNNRREVRVRLS